jgi:hypothetical protein
VAIQVLSSQTDKQATPTGDTFSTDGIFVDDLWLGLWHFFKICIVERLFISRLVTIRPQYLFIFYMCRPEMNTKGNFYNITFFRFFEPFRARLASKFAKGVQMRQFFVQKFIMGLKNAQCYVDVEFVTTSAQSSKSQNLNFPSYSACRF